MNKGFGVLIFTFGAAVGYAVAWELAKRKFSALAKEEIDSVKDVYAKRAAAREKPDLSELTRIVNKEGYSSSEPIAVADKRPYVISPDDFGSVDGYEQISLTYYADGVLTDEDDAVIDNVDEVVGEDSLTSFGAFEDDSVFVRNDILKADYEILLDERKFSEVAKKSPRKIG